MAGALVAVGQGKLRLSDIQDLLEARDSLAFPTNLMAPPHGLFLTQVEYQESGEDEDGELHLHPFTSHQSKLGFSARLADTTPSAS